MHPTGVVYQQDAEADAKPTFRRRTADRLPTVGAVDAHGISPSASAVCRVRDFRGTPSLTAA